MKKMEKEDSKARNRKVMAIEYVRVDPVMKFIAKINVARSVAALMESTHLLADLAMATIGSCDRNINESAKTFRNMSDRADMLMVNTNLALGSIR